MSSSIITGIITSENLFTLINAADESLNAQLEICTALEFRADTFKNPFDPDVVNGFQSLASRLSQNQPKICNRIFTIRLPEDGGAWRDSADHRYPLMARAIQDGLADVVDIEVENMADVPAHLINKLNKDFHRILISHHHFHPGYKSEDYGKILNVMASHSVWGYKFAVMTETLADCLEFISFSKVLRSQKKMTSMVGMGPFGPIGRVAALLLGCKLCYGWIGSGQTVPGQLNTVQLHQALKKCVTSKNHTFDDVKLIKSIEAIIEND